MTEPDNSEDVGLDAPKELVDAMHNAVDGTRNPSPEQLLEAANHLLKKVLTTNCESRASALDLLTVDALVTRAMEFAADDPQRMQHIPEAAIRGITALAQEIATE